MDTTMTSPDVTSQPPVVFRGKKRKAFRQRPTDEEAESTTKPADTAATNSTTLAQNADTPRDSDTPVPPQPSIVADAGAADKNEEEEEQVRLSVAHILRQRNARKSRLRGGVGFGADDSAARAADDDLAQMIREEEQKALEVSTGGMSKRFTAQTGFSTDLANKHMTEYVESELAKRKAAAAASSAWNLASSAASAISQDPSSSSTSAGTANQNLFTTTAAKHSALQGRLMEVDLGDEVRSRNAALTDRARRKLQGEAVDEDESDSTPAVAQPSGKVRLGRDGKPWRPRNRRGSDDIKRDQLVEEFLKENRLDVYEAPTPPPAAATSGGTGEEDYEGAADERIAEEFRREFMDAMAQRRKKKRPAQPGPKRAPNEDVLRGPKLGGSRNTRAAMRDLLLKKEKEAKRP